MTRRTALLSTLGSFAALAQQRNNRRRAEASASLGKFNVLFIAVDDLKPALGCFGDPLAITPNIDRLAAKGTLFTSAYCQQAVCSPTRTSLLTGRRPDTTKVYDLVQHFRGTIPDVVTLPQHFRNHGYITASMGKIWHGGLEDGRSNTLPHWMPNSSGAWGSAENALWQHRREAAVIANNWKMPPDAGPQGAARRATRGPAWSSPDVPDEELSDGKVAVTAVKAIETLSKDRFFLMAGFQKPHLPFIAPKRYFDLHPRAKFADSLAKYQQAPAGSPAFAMHTSGELRSYAGTPEEGPVPAEMQIDLIRAYYAAASYTDANIGRVMDALERNGIADKTIVILWGDHGWHLGDHGLWNKHSNFEQATHVPLMIHVPGQKNPGRKSAGLTEYVDIFPSLVELCGLPASPGVEGTSFAPLIDQPDRAWKPAAFSQYPRPSQEHGPLMGYSMRTRRHRLTLWLARKDGKEADAELFDYEQDPMETRNLIKDPAYSQTVRQLRAQFAKGWRGAVPAI